MTEQTVTREDVGTRYEIVDMGIQEADQIQPCGMVFTNLKRMVMGKGNNPKDAAISALEEIHNTYLVDGNLIYAQVAQFFKWEEFPSIPDAKAPSSSIVNNPVYVVCVRF